MSRFFVLFFLNFLIFQEAVSQTYNFIGPEDTSVCHGDTAVFVVSISPDAESIRWECGSSVSGPWDTLMMEFEIINDTLLRIFDSESYDGKYFRVVVLDTGVVVDSSDSASLTVNPLPIAEISAGGPTTFCEGNSVTLTASSAMSYAWSNGGNMQSITVFDSGDYSVTVTDLNGCSSSSPATSVIVNPLPIAEISAGGPTTFCQGNSVTLTASSAMSYAWSNGGNMQSITVFDSANYSVTLTGMNGCTASSTPTLVTVNSLPVAAIFPSGPTTFCQGNSVTLIASPAMSYTWSNGGNMQSITVFDSANYSVTLTGMNGCTASSTPTFVTVNPNPIAGFTTMPPELENSIIDVDQRVYFIDTSLGVSAESPIANWKWNFGTFAEPETYDSTISPGAMEVKYTQGGDKKAVLKVTDIKGCMHADSIRFSVNSDSLPSVQMTLIQQAICLGDKMIIEVSVKTLDKPNYKVLPMIELSIHNGSGVISPLNIITSNDENYTAQYCIVFDQFGNPEIEAIGFQQHKSTSVIVSDTVVREFNSGSAVPQVSGIVPSSLFLCRGDLLNFDVFISPMEDADINYTINNIPQPLGQVNYGYIRIENIPASIGMDQIVLNIVSIDLGNGCKNNSPNFVYSIPVKPKPIVTVDEYTEACQGTPHTIFATGANSYLWFKDHSTLVSDTDFLIIPTESLQTIIYRVEGTTDGCTTKDTIEVKVVAPPNPIIIGDTVVCLGQVKVYKSDIVFGNEWAVEAGEIIGINTDSISVVRWNAPGVLTLKQTIGGCSEEAALDVTVSNENSPPFDTLVYLKGGGILLYPNPDLIPGLCYRWFKDGQLQPDQIYQGYVVGNQPESELSRYTVEVSYCGLDTTCAQTISYRSIEEEEVITDFQLKVVPNPNSGDFILEYEVNQSGNYLQYLFDSSGRLIRKEDVDLEKGAGNLNMTFHSVTSGIYFIKWINSMTGESRVIPVSILK